MKTLYVLRHAKSSWDDANLSDFERPLNARGLEAAPLVGKAMRTNQFAPEKILSSPASRAAQTARLIQDAAQIGGDIEFHEQIYEASPSRLLEIVRAQNENLSSIMLVGHNPGLEGLINFLTGALAPMPTAALAVVDLEVNKWHEVNASTGNLRTLIRPKEL